MSKLDFTLPNPEFEKAVDALTDAELNAEVALNCEQSNWEKIKINPRTREIFVQLWEQAEQEGD